MIILALGAASCHAVPARLEHATVEHEVEWVTPCARDSQGWAHATRAIDGLERAIEALEPGDDTEPLVELFYDTMADECLQIAGDAPWPQFASALSARSWWERGGEEWLRSLWQTDEIVLPPQELDALTLEATQADHPLRPLLCSATDAGCGRATRAWRLRAEYAFSQAGTEWQANVGGVYAFWERCEREARTEPSRERYQSWWSCVDSGRDYVASLPHGHVRAPDEGWLLVRRNRAFYDCPEIGAYDLATGAAYVVRMCEPESYDELAHYTPRQHLDRPTLITGRFPLDVLREAAWMLLLEPYVVWGFRPSSTRIAIPFGIKRLVSPGSGGGFWGLPMCTSSHSSPLEWAWLRAGVLQARGMIQTPGCAPGEEHAYQLFTIAEAAFVEGCPPAPFPAGLESWDPGGPSLLHQQLMRDGAARPACAPP